jgi:hypothetical protein
MINLYIFRKIDKRGQFSVNLNVQNILTKLGKISVFNLNVQVKYLLIYEHFYFWENGQKSTKTWRVEYFVLQH